jgi:hypothetical protein
MYWVNFLHIYQPSDQSKEILERVVNESYKPLFEGFLKIKKCKINLNINGALTEFLAREGYKEIIANIKKLSETGRLEFTESAKYHALLPFLSDDQIKRQVEKNRKTNRMYFGKSYKPVCFFPPEMAYSKNVGRVISELGYKMILLDEISYKGEFTPIPKDYLVEIKDGKNIIAAFRERRVSNCIMSALIRNGEEFIELLKDDLNKNEYLCTAMDGETFGHHRPGLEKTLFKIISNEKPDQLFLSELPNHFEKKESFSPLMSTWASSQEDIDKGIQFYSWKDPKNKVHKLQWKFFNYVVNLSRKKTLTQKSQEKIDRAIASDQFFWASGEPWWSIEVIEKGAWMLLEALKSMPRITNQQIKKGEEYYKEILSTAFWWQRSGKIEKMAKQYKETTKIPFKERTLEAGKPEVYHAFVEMMERKMKEATKDKNFEKAILWRDAIWKLETKNDIYDAIHAVDLLRKEVADLDLKELMDRYKEKYKKIKSGQPELRKI